MTRAIASARRACADPMDCARTLVVAACAMALIAAGQALPF
jgi:hypothetical protein